MSITLEFKVDWDATDWRATPDFSQAIDDITTYVKNRWSIERGKNVELGNSPAGTLEIVLNNVDKRFTPLYASSPLYGKMRPWLPVRVRATVSGEAIETFYVGFISKISVNPHQNIKEAYLYCTDGMDLLARNMIAMDKTDRLMVTDGAAIDSVLDGAGWPAGKRDIDIDGGAIVNYPSVAED